jgi:hypothetical protein
MKKVIVALVFIVFGLINASSQNNQSKPNPIGTWKFAAPYAPEGYSSGTIILGFSEQKHTATMAFSGSEYKIPAENVKAVNDSVLFSIFLEGQDVKVMLKIENDTNMSGKAVYSEGEVPLALSRVLAAEAESKK